MENKHIILDQEFIDRLGGTTRVAQLLNMSKQRVHNWYKRGIPASVKLDNFDLFFGKKGKNVKQTRGN